MRVLVVCAVGAELKGLRARDGVDILAAGIGPVEAGAQTARALASGSYGVAVNAGIAGAFRGRARVGEAVIVAEERYADFGLETGATPVLAGGITLCDRAFSDDDLLARCAGLPYAVGTGVTVTRVTATDATARRLVETYDADVESMEGFAVLRACSLARVPALEVRGISNLVGDREQSGWDFSAGARATVAATEAVLDRIAGARATTAR